MDLLIWIALALVVTVLVVLVRADLSFVGVRRVQARGTVYDHHKSNDGDGAYYSVQVRFTAEDGRTIEFTDDVGKGAPNPPVGTVVNVLYPAHDPQKAWVKRRWLRPMLYAIVLGLLGVLGARLLGWLH